MYIITLHDNSANSKMDSCKLFQKYQHLATQDTSFREATHHLYIIAQLQYSLDKQNIEKKKPNNNLLPTQIRNAKRGIIPRNWMLQNRCAILVFLKYFRFSCGKPH